MADPTRDNALPPSRFGSDERPPPQKLAIDYAQMEHELLVRQEELEAQIEEIRRTQCELESSRNAYAELYDLAPAAYLTLDEQGVIRQINLTACALLGGTRSQLVGTPFQCLIAASDRRALFRHLRCCRGDRPRIVSELGLCTRDGRALPAQLTSHQRDEAGIRSIIEDLTAEKAEQQATRNLHAALEKRVRERTAEWEIANQQLREEIARRHAAEANLLEADARKDRFLAMLGHELRNPLAPLSNVADLLELMGVDQKPLQPLSRILSRQVDQITRIVDELLDVSRIVHGKVSLHEQPLNLIQLTRDVLQDFEDEAQGRGVSLTLEAPPREVHIMGDPTRLTQVLSNLLDNALKFSGEGKQIDVKVGCDEFASQAIVSVSDNGLGIDPARLPYMFLPFEQADQGLDRGPGGLGLGLAVVRGVVQLHGGSVEAASAGLGKGSQFVVRLPWRQRVSEHPPAPPTPPPRTCDVLLIEDRAEVLAANSLLLGALGHRVETAVSGADGLQKARACRPDAIICDIGLPDVDGYQVARQLRVDPELKNVFLIALTGYGTPADVQLALDAGFDLHLVKPASKDDLQRALGALPPGDLVGR